MENKEALLKAVQDVLTEALQEMELIHKMDMTMAEDPSRPVAAPALAEAAPESDKDKDSKDDDKDEDDKDEQEDDDKDEDAHKSESAVAAAPAAVAAPAAPVVAEVQKSEVAAPVAAAPAPVAPASDESLKKAEAQIEDLKKVHAESIEALKKSHDEQVSELKKSLNEMSEKIAKIGAQPVARKGAAGYAPVKKSETDTLEQEQAKPLNKAEVVDKLLELKKSGKAVDTALINRVETNRLTPADVQHLKGTLGF